jgi:membrane protease YdiL (CAAX protease family)
VHAIGEGPDYHRREVMAAATFSKAAAAASAYALAIAPLGSPVLMVVAFFCGLSWGTLRAATASLIPALVAHLLWDLLVLLWLPLISR